MFWLYVIWKCIEVLLIAVFVVAAGFFFALYIIVRGIVTFVSRELLVQRAAKSNWG
jgi:hypothetical protein